MIKQGSDARPWILGVNVGLHDSSAALVKGTEFIAIGEQERFSRNKRAGNEAPHDAIRFCLRQAAISPRDLSAIAIGTDVAALHRYLGLDSLERSSFPSIESPSYFFPPELLDQVNCSTVQVPHHIAHAASAFYASGFKEAAIVVVDNRGEDCSTTLAIGTDRGISIIETLPVEESLGLYYRVAAEYAGLCGTHREVGKLMGLAAYGRATESVPLEVRHGGPRLMNLPTIDARRGADVAPLRAAQLMTWFRDQCFPFAAGLTSEIMAYANFAASVQQSLEAAILSLATKLRAHTASDAICLAGGVALNCSANGRLAAEAIFARLFVTPMAHDSGVALGAALETSRMLTGQCPSEPQAHAYWGAEFSPQEILIAIEPHGLVVRQYQDDEEYVDVVSGLLDADRIVGWFQGRAEVGPRALGARSILASPRSRQTLVRVNRIKGREVWRPLAPSILEEAFAEYFDCNHHSPFMLVAAKVRREKQRLIPAVVHVDGTSRPQAVSRQTNPRFWKLIKRFGERSGVPILLNTSFNMAGEPIVHSPANAVHDFLSSDLDVLAIGDLVVTKGDGG